MWPDFDYVSNNPDYNKAKEIHSKLCEAFGNADALYEYKIIDHCGQDGLELLREYNFIELCAVLEYGKLYAL